MSDKRGVLHKFIKRNCPDANFVHCYSHQLSLITVHPGSQYIEVRIISSNVDYVGNFLLNSLERVDVLTLVVERI